MPDNEKTMEEMEEMYKEPDPNAEPKEPPPPPPPATDSGPGVDAYKEALRISEDARRRLEESVAARPVPAEEQPDAIEGLSDDQLTQLIEEKGVVAAVRAVQAQTFKIADKHFSRRMAGMADAGVNVAEAEARRKYAVEFELFGDQIAEQVKAAPDKGALANPIVWDNLISYVRGKSGNIEKLIEKRTETASLAAAEAARAAQRDAAGVHMPTGAARRTETPVADETYGLDRTEQEIANTLGVPLKEYAAELGRI